MKISSLCIDRPVFSFVLSAMIILVGLLSFKFVKLQFEPSVFKPTLVVSTSYSGASAEVVQNDVTQKIVSAVAGAQNLSYVEATSRQGQSRVVLNFGDITQEKFLSAQSEVMRDVGSVKLPESVDAPVIQQRGSSSEIIFVGFADQSRTTQEVASYVNDSILKQILQIPGVGDAELWSDTSALRIELNPKQLSALKISPIDVVDKLEKLNVNVSAGQLLTAQNSYTINVNSALSDIPKFESLVIAKRGDKLIRLSQLAEIYLGALSIQGGSLSFVNKQPGVVIGVTPTSDANPIEVANKVSKMIQQLATSLPSGMTGHVLLNLATPLKTSLYEVVKTIFEAVFLVALVSLLFLGRMRAALVPIVTLPVCLIGVFAIIWPLGFSINMMTLLALVLAVGLVVDDTIVVLENCFRYRQKGLAPIEAARKGSSEIGFAIIGMTITLIAVYMPIAFMTGKSAVFFKEFAFTLAASILISGFVALTLTPSMCAHMLGDEKENRYEKFVVRLFSKLEIMYQKSLSFILTVRGWLIVLFVILIGMGWMLFKTLPMALQPNDTIGVVGIMIQGENSTSTDYLVKKLNEVETQSETEGLFSNSFGMVMTGGQGDLMGLSFNTLKPDEFSQSSAVSMRINKVIGDMKGVKGGSFVIPLSGSEGGFGKGDIQMYIVGMASYDSLYSQADRFINILEQLPAVQTADTAVDMDNAQFELNINFTNAALLDVDGSKIQTLLNIMFGGQKLKNDYQINGQSYPIIVQLPKKNLDDFSVLDKLYVKSDENQWIQLSRLVNVVPIVKAPSLLTYNQMNAVQINVSLNPGYSIGDVVTDIQQLSHEALLPGTSAVFKGQAKDMLEGNSSMVLIFIAGLVFIYLVLAALFESFIDPFVILLTVPLCVVGALFGLKLIGGSLNIYTEIGLVTLVGLVSKHGILIVQFANELLAKGSSIREAVIKGASTRLRPVLMTTVTMVLGAIPLLYTSGVGEHARQQIGMVIVAGMLLGSFFSLFVVPVAYSLLVRLKRNLKY
jgi:multidrug efflux pump